MDTKHAIRTGIQKWRYILESESTLDFGMFRCWLCTLFHNGNCSGCPLFENDFGCLQDGSNFELYSKAVEEICKPDQLELQEVEDKKLQKKLKFHIELMIKHLEICLEEENS